MAAPPASVCRIRDVVDTFIFWVEGPQVAVFDLRFHMTIPEEDIRDDGMRPAAVKADEEKAKIAPYPDKNA